MSPLGTERIRSFRVLQLRCDKHLVNMIDNHIKTPFLTLTHWPSFYFSRIYEILPSRIQQWQAKPCVAQEKNKEELEKIRQEQSQARLDLVELDKKHKELDALIEIGKKGTVATEEEVCKKLKAFRIIIILMD